MADNYCLFSFRINLETEQEVNWAKKIIQDKPKSIQYFCDSFDEGEDEELGFQYAFLDIQGSTELCIFSDGEAYEEAVLNFLKLFLQYSGTKLKKIGFSAAYTCSKPRAGEFFGCGFVVHKTGRVEASNTHDWLEKKLANKKAT